MNELRLLHRKLKACQKCPDVCGRAVHGQAFETKIMLIGQAPGIHEEGLGKPFAHTAGRTLFKWLHDSLGLSEEDARELIYFTAVARCFPGKAKSGQGDRVPSRTEIENCREFLKAEVELIQPKLILAVGRIAILEVLKESTIEKSVPLEDLVGRIFKTTFHGQPVEVLPLPHPSGVSRWPTTEPGKTKLKLALSLLNERYQKLRL